MLYFSKSLPVLQSRWVFLSGVFTGIATLFKLTGLAPFIAQVAFLGALWLIVRPFPFSRVLGALFTACAGLALAWLPFLIYFASHGALRDLIEASVVYPFYFSAAIPKSLFRYTQMLVTYLGDVSQLLVFVLIGLCVWVWNLSPRGRVKASDENLLGESRWYFLAGLWVASDLATALAGNRSQGQYFLPVMLSLAAVTGLTYTRYIERQGASPVVRVTVLALLLSPLMITYFTTDVRSAVHLVRYGHILRHDAEFGHDQPALQEQLNEVAAFIQQTRDRDDTLFSWDLDPWLFQMLDIRSPIHVLDAGFRRQLVGDVRRQFVQRILNELTLHPPTFIVDTTADPNASMASDSQYAVFADFVRSNYTCVNTFRLDGNVILRVYKRSSTA
jgi:hypothetical protein